jgi:hypothetical protein
MTGSVQKIEEYAELEPKNYPVLGSLQLTQGLGPSGECEQTLLAVFQKDLDDVTTVLRIDFFGVRGLSLSQPEWSLIEVDYLEILSPIGLPDGSGKYLVHDASQDRVLRFECRDFTAQLIG